MILPGMNADRAAPTPIFPGLAPEVTVGLANRTAIRPREASRGRGSTVSVHVEPSRPSRVSASPRLLLHHRVLEPIAQEFGRGLPLFQRRLT